jgi:hypothetical protein
LLSNFLCIITSEGISGLQLIAKENPKALSVLFELANTNTEFAQKLGTAICTANLGQSNGLHTIAQHAPDSLGKLLEIAKNNDDLMSSLGTALRRTDQHGRSGLEIIARYAPKYLKTLFDFGTSNKLFMWNLECAIANSNDLTNCLFLLAKYAPTCLDRIPAAMSGDRVAEALAKVSIFGNRSRLEMADHEHKVQIVPQYIELLDVKPMPDGTVAN